MDVCCIRILLLLFTYLGWTRKHMLLHISRSISNPVAATLILVLVSVASADMPDIGEIQGLHMRQKESLEDIFFHQQHNGKTIVTMPPQPDKAELSSLRKKMWKLTSAERKELRRLYGKSDAGRELTAYALRDSDGDTIPDFRISDGYFGKLSEGDLDLDGDCVRNVLDEAPYDPGVGGRVAGCDWNSLKSDPDRVFLGIPDPGTYRDVNRNLIPDHVDWRLFDWPDDHHGIDQLAEIQEQLYYRHLVLLVNRDRLFTLSLAEASRDAVMHVFAGMFGRLGVTRPFNDVFRVNRQDEPDLVIIPTLRTIAAEDSVYIRSANKKLTEENQGTNAVVTFQTQTLSVYDSGIRFPGLLHLGLMVHELGHNLEAAFDYNPGDKVAGNTQWNFTAPGFYQELKPLGWDTTPTPADQQLSGLVSFDYVLSGPEESYLGKAPAQWHDEMGSIAENTEEGQDYLENPAISRNGIVGWYSMSDAWEWYSDSLIAYTYALMEARLGHICGASTDVRALVKAYIAEDIVPNWPEFTYQNITRQETVKAGQVNVFQYFSTNYPVPDDVVDELTRRYILRDFPCEHYPAVEQ